MSQEGQQRSQGELGQDQRPGLEGHTGQQRSQGESGQDQRPGLEGHTGPITIGEALAVVAIKNPNKQVDLAVVSAVRSAEGRATGIGEGVPGGPASQLQQVIERRTYGLEDEHRLGQILSRSKDIPALQKVVNMRDAHKVGEAEMRNDSTGNIDPNGIAASMTRAAEYNIAQGHVNPQAQ